MNRRTFLRNTSALGALGLAGCMADAEDNTGRGDDGTPTPDSGDENTPEQDPEVVDSSVELLAADCSRGEHSTATVTMDEKTTTVSFSGQVTTSDPCYDVTLERAEYDKEEDQLAIVVATEANAEACSDCVGLVEFEGTVEFEGSLPGEAYVGHGDTVLTGDEGDDPGGSGEPVAPDLVDTTFTLTEVTNGAGSGDGTADVSFDSDEDTVVVTGTIIGNNGCMTAERGVASYDLESDTLSVDVMTTRRDGTEGQACTEALVAIDYEATFTFEDEIPSNVSVSHDGEGIVGAGYDSASAEAPDESNR